MKDIIRASAPIKHIVNDASSNSHTVDVEFNEGGAIGYRKDDGEWTPFGGSGIEVIYDTMPTEDTEKYIGNVVLYMGETTPDYENKHLYLGTENMFHVFSWEDVSSGGIKKVDVYEAPSVEHDLIQWVGEDDEVHGLLQDCIYCAEYRETTSGTSELVWVLQITDAEPVSDITDLCEMSEDVNGYVYRHGNLIDFYFTGSSDTDISDIASEMPKPKSASEFVATCSTTNPSSTDIVVLDGTGNLKFLSEGHKNFVVKGTYFSIDFSPAKGWLVENTVEEVNVGDVRTFANCSGQAIDGWLECDGSAVSQSDYSDLYAVISDTFDDPDNPCEAGYFRLPDIDNFGTKMPSFIRWKVTAVSTQGVVALRDLADVDGANLKNGSPLCWNEARSRWETMTSEEVIVGDVRAFAFNAAPDGWLPCNGQPFDKTEYTDLYNVIGDSFGTSSESATSGWPLLPDLNSGRFIEGGTGVGATGYKNAGLPDITGEVRRVIRATDDTRIAPTGAFKSSTTEPYGPSMYSTQASYYKDNMIFKASDSSTVYGNSSTVQPKSAQMFYCIRAVATHVEGEVKVISSYECVKLPNPVSVYTSLDLQPGCDVYQVGNVVHFHLELRNSTGAALSVDSNLVSGMPKCVNRGFFSTWTNINSTTATGQPAPDVCFRNAGDTTLYLYRNGTIPNNTFMYVEGTYITDSYTPVLPAFSRTPQDGDILKFDGTSNKWELSQDFKKTYVTPTITNAATDKGAIVWDSDKSYYLTMGAFRQLYIKFEVTEEIAAAGECRIGTWSNKPGANDKFGNMVAAPCTLYTNQNSDQWPCWVNLQTGAMYVNTGTAEHPHPVPAYNLYHIHAMWIACPEKV